MRGPGVELGRLAWFEDEVVLPKDETEPAVEDESPFVALVRAAVGLGVVASGRAVVTAAQWRRTLSGPGGHVTTIHDVDVGATRRQ